jgi:indolepyruvate ferredoxin oxidoreductase
VLKTTPIIATRIPYFCSGCPHNTSTVVPEGMRAYAGIGCHYMAQWMDRNTEGFTQMGGEGANWVGEAPFSKRGHVFQNLGDGTYNHSGVAGDPLRRRLQGQHHLQDPVQRRGRHDRRASATRAGLTGRRDRRADARRGRRAHRHRHRRARQICRARSGLPGRTSIDHRDDLDAVQRSSPACRASRC